MWLELCGHGGGDVNLVVFVACEGNSSVMLNTQIKHTWQQILLGIHTQVEILKFGGNDLIQFPSQSLSLFCYNNYSILEHPEIRWYSNHLVSISLSSQNI